MYNVLRTLKGNINTSRTFGYNLRNPMTENGFEIDYLPVGNGDKSGDAIIVKFGNLHSGRREDFQVFVIDGGTLEAGQSIVDHLREYTGSNSIELVIATHPDNDHVSGIETVLLNCTVGALLMHAPWAFAQEARLVKSLGRAIEVHDLAARQGVELYDPRITTDFFDGALTVLGPSPEYYSSLVNQFDKPKVRIGAGELSTKKSITETMEIHTETLDQAHKYTSATNNSSVIAYFNYAGKDALFTGDAGVEALTKAAITAQGRDIDLSNMHFLHVPHHGSSHNLTSELINYFKPVHSFVSASAEAKKHPHPRITNAFLRRGLKIFSTQGKGLRYHHNAPVRPEWSSANLVPFVQQFEAKASA